MRIAGIIITSIGAIGGIGLLADGSYFNGIVGGLIFIILGIIMILKGKSRAQIKEIKTKLDIKKREKKEQALKIKQEQKSAKQQQQAELKINKQQAKKARQEKRETVENKRKKDNKNKSHEPRSTGKNGFQCTYKTKQEDLLALQKIVLLNSPDKLVLSESQLKESAHSRAEQSIKIIQDCVNLINNTANPDVYFKRYDMLKHHMHILGQLESYVGFSGELPSVSLKKMTEEEQASIKCFIDRYYDSVCAKVSSLKTEKAKLNHIQEFHDTLQGHFSIMNQNNINYVNDLYDATFNTVFDEYH